MKIITEIKKLFIFSILINGVFLIKLNSENLNSNSLESKESEGIGIAGQLNGQIYLKGKASLEKNKKTHLTTQTNTSVNKKEKENSTLKTKQSENLQSHSNSNKLVFDNPIILETWVKYFKYTNNELNVKTPKSFFVNSGFYQQTRLFPNADVSKDNDLIKNKNYFYLSLFKNSLVFSTSKKVKIILKIN